MNNETRLALMFMLTVLGVPAVLFSGLGTMGLAVLVLLGFFLLAGDGYGSNKCKQCHHSGLDHVGMSDGSFKCHVNGCECEDFKILREIGGEKVMSGFRRNLPPERKET